MVTKRNFENECTRCGDCHECIHIDEALEFARSFTVMHPQVIDRIQRAIDMLEFVKRNQTTPDEFFTKFKPMVDEQLQNAIGMLKQMQDENTGGL